MISLLVVVGEIHLVTVGYASPEVDISSPRTRYTQEMVGFLEVSLVEPDGVVRGVMVITRGAFQEFFWNLSKVQQPS